LHGARNPKHLEILILALESFKQLEFPSSLWDRVGLNLSKLRKAGISFPFNDVALATLAVDKGLPFWTFDKQFLMIQKALPELTLFDETLEKSTIIPE
jgi:predicted nucleic acid-binding protein